jgi:tetratricopeptide (TPR) repeat protein
MINIMIKKEMKRTASTILTVLLLSVFSFALQAQKGIETGTPFGRGEDSTRCLRNTSLYSTYYENKDYNMAVQFWRPVFTECPGSSKNTYIKGETMFKDFFRKTGNKAYIDTVLMILDQRTKYFNEEPANNLRKAFALYEFGGNDPVYARQCYDLIKGVMDHSPQSFDHTYSSLYMAITAKCYALKLIEAPEVITAYSNSMKVVDNQLARKPGDPRFMEARKNIDAVFRSSGAASCENLEHLFTAGVENNPGDTAMLRKVITLLTETGCRDSELYYKTATSLYRSDPSASSAAQLAEMNLARKKYNEANKYYTEAIDLETDSKVKSGLLTKLATLELTSDSKQAARDFAKAAYSLDPTNGNALFIVAESYAGARIGEAFENQTVYWVVVDYLVRAKNTDPTLKEQVDERIAIYSRLFPTKEEAFFRSLVEEGAPYQVGGWINESTTVRFRKE